MFADNLLPMLRFWGVPIRTVDLAEGSPADLEPASVALVLLADEGIAAERYAAVAGLLDASVASGAGVVVCDPTLAVDAPETERLEITARSWSAVRPVRTATVGPPHFITAMQRSLKHFAFAKPVPALPRSAGEGVALLQSGAGEPLLSVGSGRVPIVRWGLSTSVWARDSFGFGRGLDALLWRSLLWAARKPFAIAAFPPFGRFRFDDCQGWWREPEDLAFLDVMREFDEVPNLSICLSAPSKSAWRVLAEGARAGRIEVTPHVQEPDIGIYNVADNAAEGGQGDDPLAARIRDLFASHACPMSASVSDHNHEITPRGIRIARALGMKARMNVLRVGETWDGLHRDWSPAPFGRLNFALDAFVDAPELFTAINHHISFDQSFTRLGKGNFLCTTFGGFTEDRWDFLNGLFGEDGDFDVDAAAERLQRHAELAMTSLFFVGGISHSHFIRLLVNDDWRRLLDAYRGYADPNGHLPRPYDEIAGYAARRAELGDVQIEPQPVAASEGEPLWGLIAHAERSGCVVEWQPLRHKKKP